MEMIRSNHIQSPSDWFPKLRFILSVLLCTLESKTSKLFDNENLKEFMMCLFLFYIFTTVISFLLVYIDSYFLQRRICFLFVSLQFEFCLKCMDYNYKCQQNIMISFGEYHVFIVWLFSNFDKALLKRLTNIECSVYLMFKVCCLS